MTHHEEKVEGSESTEVAVDTTVKASISPRKNRLVYSVIEFEPDGKAITHALFETKDHADLFCNHLLKEDRIALVDTAVIHGEVPPILSYACRVDISTGEVVSKEQLRPTATTVWLIVDSVDVLAKGATADEAEANARDTWAKLFKK